jgi:integrase
MAKLTTAHVNGLKAQGRRYVVRNDSLVGYEIRVEASGLRTAFVRYTVDGQRRRFKLGRIGEQYTPAQTRKDARERLGEVAHGGDPARDRRLRAEAPTFAHVAESFMSEHARPYRKASTADKYQDLLDAHLVPKLGKMPIEDVTRADAERIHQAVRKETPGQANRVIALLSVIMSKAEAWGYRPMQSNPCYKLPKFKGRKIERFLSGEERARLDASIAVAEAAIPGQEEYVARGAITAIRLLSLTGARSGEIVGLQWAWVALEHACLRLPDSKTGAKVVPLSAHAVAYLGELAKGRREGAVWVCPNERGGQLANIERAWRSIRKRAALEDVRLHDLRHSFASDAVAAGVPLAVIRHMMGHKSVTTTDRYAHLAWTTVHEGTDAVGERIERSTREGAERLREEKERREREQAKQAAGAEHGGGKASEGAAVVAMGGGNVLRFPGKRRG